MTTHNPSNPVREIRREGQCEIVSLIGDVDLYRSGELQQVLAKVVDRRPGRIVLDLTEVRYMDSSGVASLVKLLSTTRRQNIELRLCCLGARVRSIFEITRLDTVFEILPSLAEALA